MGEEVRLTDSMIPFLEPGLLVIGEDWGWDIKYDLVGITPIEHGRVSGYDQVWTMPVKDVVPCEEKGLTPGGLFLVLNKKDHAFLMKGEQLLDPRMNLAGLRIGIVREGK